MADLQNGVVVICHLAPGSRFNSNVLVVENLHTHHKNNLDAGGFCCSESKNGCAVRLLALEDGTYFMTTGHDGHDNKEDHLKNPGVPKAYDANLERAVERSRRSAQLPVPRTIDEAQASLIASELYNKTADGTSNFYHGRVSTPSGTALVFISLVMLPLLRTSEEIACDGTFATLPLLFSQQFVTCLQESRVENSTKKHVNWAPSINLGSNKMKQFLVGDQQADTPPLMDVETATEDTSNNLDEEVALIEDTFVSDSHPIQSLNDVKTSTETFKITSTADDKISSRLKPPLMHCVNALNNSSQPIRDVEFTSGDSSLTTSVDQVTELMLQLNVLKEKLFLTEEKTPVR
ncbi:hypothetical protein OUZ56_010550 [Daphnia magna]|uniref:Uncharacterized protein n=1 Tax=Daphnia magna TaxID=35525 RepID=A0ABR0AJ17_9CRUS|nr:hypothetical protein OUZ56_010550 [Daphnia magna]